MAPRILIRADGHYQFGLGHMYRSLTVATGLREAGAEVCFASLGMLGETGFTQVLSERGFCLGWASGANPFIEDNSAMARLISDFQPSAILTDLLTPDAEDGDLRLHSDLVFPDRVAQIAKYKQFGVPVVSFTDEQECVAIRPDIVINHSLYRPVEDYENWVSPKFHVGPKYFPIGEDVKAAVTDARVVSDQASRLLVQFGGSDHNGYTLKAAKAATRAGLSAIDVVIGPAVANQEVLCAELEQMGCTVHRSLPSIAHLMAAADIAVTSGGNTVFEFAALGTPTITLCVRERQNTNADYFERHGTLRNLGLGDEVSEEMLLKEIAMLASDKGARQEMSDSGRASVDGQGRDRAVAAILSASIEDRNREGTEQ